MLDGTLSKLQVILKTSKISLKEIRAWEREKIRQRIINVALRRYWLYEQIIYDAKSISPQRLFAYSSN